MPSPEKQAAIEAYVCAEAAYHAGELEGGYTTLKEKRRALLAIIEREKQPLPSRSQAGPTTEALRNIAKLVALAMEVESGGERERAIESVRAARAFLEREEHVAKPHICMKHGGGDPECSCSCRVAQPKGRAGESGRTAEECILALIRADKERVDALQEKVRLATNVLKSTIEPEGVDSLTMLARQRLSGMKHAIAILEGRE